MRGQLCSAWLLQLIVAAPAVVTGCFSVNSTDRQYVCGPEQLCPPGMRCGQDNFCYENSAFSDGGADVAELPDLITDPPDDLVGDVGSVTANVMLQLSAGSTTVAMGDSLQLA